MPDEKDPLMEELRRSFRDFDKQLAVMVSENKAGQDERREIKESMHEIKNLLSQLKNELITDKADLKAYMTLATNTENKVAKLEDSNHQTTVDLHDCCTRVTALEQANKDRVAFNRWAIPTFASCLAVLIAVMTFILVQVLPRLQVIPK